MRILPITRSDYIPRVNNKRSNWLDSLAERLYQQESKSPSPPKSSSLVDQINSLWNKKHTTVAAIVKDYQEKIGLNEYLENISKKNEQNVKKAQTVPESLKALPKDVQTNLIQFIINKIRTYHGQISIPAVQSEALITFRSQGISSSEIETPEMAKFINDEIVKELSNHPDHGDVSMNIGLGTGATDIKDSSQANDDAWLHLMPNTGGR